MRNSDTKEPRRMDLLYVAGPYRAPTERGLIENIRMAEAIAFQLWHMGFAVICPHLNTAHFGGEDDDSLWLDGDLEMIRRCDALVTVPVWEHSDGTQQEVWWANWWGLPVFHWYVDAGTIRAKLKELR